MTNDSFDIFYRRLQHLYQEAEFSQALDLATRGLEQYPENSVVLDYWRMTMAARTGDEDLALRVLELALEQGNWYSEVLLRRSPSFKLLQGNPKFEQLVARNQVVAEQDHQGEFPIYTLRPQGRCASGGLVCPLLLGLHSNAATAYGSLPLWTPAAAAGWLVAAPQSTQAIWKGAYVWNDRDIAEKDVQRHFATLRETYAVDPLHTVLAGHSIGGEIAIWLALRNAIELRGFMAIGPGGPLMDDLDGWGPLLEGNFPPDLRGYVIIGKEDATIPHENIRQFVDQLNEAGIACELEVVPDAGPDPSPDYDPAVLRGLEFIVAG